MQVYAKKKVNDGQLYCNCYSAKLGGPGGTSY